MVNSFFALIIGYFIDLAVGDPRWLLHPVSLIGRLISLCERLFRRVFPKTDSGELYAGIALVLTVTAISAGGAFFVLRIARRLGGDTLCLAVESIMCWQSLAVKSLKTESMRVHRALTHGSCQDARIAVAAIVGRDTFELDNYAITKATVETVAENTSDGVVAPMLWCAVGGGVCGFLYKSINTMDSMIGYKNVEYLYLGRAAALLDDAANWLPSRLSALLMIAVSPLIGLDARRAWRIWRRDRRNHDSPNSAQTESACAGALGIRLGGDARYKGVLHKKEYIGDDTRLAEYDDIPVTCRLMYAVSAAAMTLCVIFKGVAVLLAGAV